MKPEAYEATRIAREVYGTQYNGQVIRAIRLAYAAGRKAGMEEAMSHAYRHSGSTKVADDICDAIRTAMEADK